MKLTPDQLLASDPDCYNAIVAIERDRIQAHLRAAKASGLHELAAAAIADGRDFEAVAEQHLAMARNRRDVMLRELEGEEAASVTADLDVAPNAETGDDFGMSVVKRVEVMMGIDSKLAAKRAAKAKEAAL